jgi:PilZ domain
MTVLLIRVARLVQHERIKGGTMGERRKARRYEVYLPLQVSMSRRRPAEYYTAQLRDISRTGIYFHSNVALQLGAGLELTFALPTDKDRGTSVLVRASAKALRITPISGETTPMYGVAATIDRIDFVRPIAANAAA